MSDYTRYGAMEEEQEKLKTEIDELKKMLSSSRKDFDVEREARIKAENDLKVVKHDQELQEKQIKDLQAELEKEKKYGKSATINGAKVAAKCDAVEGMCKAYKSAFEVVLEKLYGDDDDDD